MTALIALFCKPWKTFPSNREAFQRWKLVKPCRSCSDSGASEVSGSTPLSQKSWKPSSAGWIDRRFLVTQMCSMKAKNIMSAWLKVLTCLSFALALVFSAPSASHAASGMHGGEHAETRSSDHKVDSQAHGAMPAMTLHDMPVAATETADETQASSECCNGICISVAITDTDVFSVDQATKEEYLMLHAQTNSIDSSGFLRPPQFLI